MFRRFLKDVQWALITSRQHTHSLVSWFYKFIQKLQRHKSAIMLNRQNLLRLRFSVFQFRFRDRVRKNMVQTTRRFKPYYCLQMLCTMTSLHDCRTSKYGHWPFKMVNFKLVKNGYVFTYSSIIISKLAKWAMFSNSRYLERFFKNKLFLECSFWVIFG